ncbi:hypothetical protein HMPREF1145_1555 [Oribacterium parvum ACB8]|nr:hypothetical protein HMPREF1145_1555 [Oribacterium parvum ACB8]
MTFVRFDDEDRANLMNTGGFLFRSMDCLLALLVIRLERAERNEG